MVDEGEARVNYHLIEIESEQSNCFSRNKLCEEHFPVSLGLHFQVSVLFRLQKLQKTRGGSHFRYSVFIDE